MKKHIFHAVLLLLVGMFITSCEKKDTDFKEFFDNQEIVYPGIVAKVTVLPGKNRVGLAWNPSPDPSISGYIIYWNNGRDSLKVNATTHSPLDTIKAIVPNLNEFTYSFTIFSCDADGNRSIPTMIDNVKVYGENYQSLLLNRPYNASTPYALDENTSAVTLNFDTPDTINIATEIRYTTLSGVQATKEIKPTSSSITLTDYKPSTDILYRSSYIPAKGAIDTFQVSDYDTFPRIFRYVQCDKSLFREVNLPNDVGTYSSETSISKLWDGTTGPQGFPNIFHSDGAYNPHVLTFDLGRSYSQLARIEETGRDCCNNPDKFEVWGIEDITNAATTLRPDNAGWKDEAISKGWTLLKEVTRTDDGKAPMKFDLTDNLPPVRYIRIRVLHTTTGSAYSNMSEITLWNKE
ncbi:DUF4998 domain-containing protein [Desertivirga xinjiangensis]|uniref:DUF4998 domain-containing protein n=1 Tax=Desertivirga xinjiangensis TaxID=539206 RepID=UPI00210F0270|nr:DUF4998 domain-containing protein [Pedobacter xinjiangensis]